MSEQATARATQEYGAQTSLGGSRVEAAPIVLRVLAYIADLCVASTVVAIALIVNIVAGLEMGWVLLGVGAAVAIIASIVLHGLYGASPGKILAGLTVVDTQTLRPIGFPSSAIRSVVFNVLAPLVYLPGWSVLADGDRRGVHEKASRSTVVDDLDVATAVRPRAAAPSGPLGGLVTGDADNNTLQRIPTPLPEETARVDAAPSGAETEAVEPRERLQPPSLPPLPDDVPGLRPIPPRFGPPPTEGDAPAPSLPPAAAFAPPPQQTQPQPPQQRYAPRPTGAPAGQPPAQPPVGRPMPPQGQPPQQGQPVSSRPAGAVPGGTGPGGAPIVLRFDDGHSVDVRSDGIIGREPVLPGGADPAKVTKHVLVDDTASVSKTHLLFGITRGELWVEDVGSTNGSAIAFGDSWTELTKGVRYAVEKGSVVHMGQRSFKVFGG